MSWVAIIAAIFKVISAATDYLQQKQAIDQASAEIFSRYAKGALDEIAAAKQAREGVRAAINADPGELRRPDQFKRPGK